MEKSQIASKLEKESIKPHTILMSEDTISIITYNTPQPTSQPAKVEGAKHFDAGSAYPVPRMGKRSQDSEESGETVEVAQLSVGDVSVEKLEQEMSHLMNVVERLMAKTERRTQTAQIQLDEIELSVEINSQGKMSLLGSGISAGGKGGIKLKFKRQNLKNG
ncbi:MAG: hypothetical protein KA714_02165 [Limnoraphis sp. WC205]|nr:hypothetical protein [Limnoraphis sp. WC205]